MTRSLKIVSMLALVAAVGLIVSEPAFANCQNEGPYPIVQCGSSTWFSPAPANAGTVKAQWWQLGFGNNTFQFSELPVPYGTYVAPDGSGLVQRYDYYAPGYYTSEFIGNDSGGAPLDLSFDAATSIGSALVPANAFCFSSKANWGDPALDGCADNNRKRTDALTTPGDQSNNYINNYFRTTPGAAPFYGEQLDAPMAAMLTESNGLYVALAFFASKSRNANQNDLSRGQYDMGDITNGDPNPVSGASNVIPWQPIPLGADDPGGSVALASFVDPNDTTSARNMQLNFTPLRIIHDNSTRKCCFGPGCANLCQTLGGATGVGVLDQGVLVRYAAQTKPLLAPPDGTCDPNSPWVTVASVDQPTLGPDPNSISVTVPGNTCLRLNTIPGRSATASVDPTLPGPVNAEGARRGTFGDLGYELPGREIKIGLKGPADPLIADRAVLTAVKRQKYSLLVEWSTVSEVNVTSFDIVAIGKKGDRLVLKSGVPAKQSVTGRGASYSETIDLRRVKLKGRKSFVIVSQPSGQESQPLGLR